MCHYLLPPPVTHFFLSESKERNTAELQKLGLSCRIGPHRIAVVRKIRTSSPVFLCHFSWQNAIYYARPGFGRTHEPGKMRRKSGTIYSYSILTAPNKNTLLLTYTLSTMLFIPALPDAFLNLGKLICQKILFSTAHF